MRFPLATLLTIDASISNLRATRSYIPRAVPTTSDTVIPRSLGMTCASPMMRENLSLTFAKIKGCQSNSDVKSNYLSETGGGIPPAFLNCAQKVGSGDVD
jgi:hypothetical protein